MSIESDDAMNAFVGKCEELISSADELLKLSSHLHDWERVRVVHLRGEAKALLDVLESVNNEGVAQ